MLPWGPPDTKFSLGTPKSHIGKPWNFAKLTHGLLNSYHRVAFESTLSTVLWPIGRQPLIVSYWEHLVDFSPELLVAIDHLSPFLAYQSAGQSRLQLYPAQNYLSGFGNLLEEILPVLVAWTLAKGQPLHFWRHVFRCFSVYWKLASWLFCCLFQLDLLERVFCRDFRPLNSLFG